MTTQLYNDLVPVALHDPSLNFFWYDTGVDVSDVSLNQRILIVTDEHPLTLVHDSGTIFKAVNYFNLIDTVFDDRETHDGINFYTSYKQNYQTVTKTNPYNDLLLDAQKTSGTDLVTMNTAVFENNSLYFDLSGISQLSHSTDFDVEYDISLTTNFTYLPVTDTSVNNTFKINFKYYPYVRGIIEPIRVPKLYVGDTGVYLDICVNTLSDSAYLTFTTDLSANQNDLSENQFPYPSVNFARLVPFETDISLNFGSNVEHLLIDIPDDIVYGLKTGSWNYTLILHDGDYVQTLPLYMEVMPKFSDVCFNNFDTDYYLDMSHNYRNTFTQHITVSYSPADIVNADLLAWHSFIEVEAYIGDLSKNSVSYTHNYFTFDTGAQNLPNITDVAASISFDLSYNGKSFKIKDNYELYVVIRWRPHGACCWKYRTANLHIKEPYKGQNLPVYEDYGNGSFYTSPVDYLYDISRLYGDISANDDLYALFNFNTTLVSTTKNVNDIFSGAQNSTTYYFAVVDSSLNTYEQTISDPFTVNFYSGGGNFSPLSLVNNYDGTYRVDNIPSDFSNNVFVVSDDSNVNGQQLDPSNNYTFTTSLNHYYYATIYINGNQYSSMNSVTVYGYGKLGIVNNYDGTFSANNIPSYLNSGDYVVLITNHDVYNTHTPFQSDYKFQALTYSTSFNIYSVGIANGQTLYTNTKSDDLNVSYDPSPGYPLTITNNYDGNYTVTGIFPVGQDYITLHDITSNSYITLTGPYQFQGVANHEYQAYLTSGGHQYTNYTTDPLTVYYSHKLTVTNNYNGTFSVNTPDGLQSGDQIVMIGAHGSEYIYNNPFVGTVGKTYIATIKSNGNNYTNLESDSFTVYYNTTHVTLQIIASSNSTLITASYPYSLAPGDQLVIIDIYNNQIIDSANDNSLSITPNRNTEYTATIKSGSNYYQLYSNTVSWHYANVTLQIVNNYDGTFSVSNFSLYDGNQIQVVDLTSQISTNITYFTGVIGNSYQAQLHPYISITSNVVTVNYDTSLSIVNTYDGRYSVEMTNDLQAGDSIIVRDLSNSQLDLIFNSKTDISFSGVYGHSYYATVLSDGNEYTNLKSNTVTVKYQSHLTVTNNYDGTFSVNTPDGLQPGDQVVIVDNNENKFIYNGSFVGRVGQTYTATIKSNGNNYTNLRSETFSVYYSTPLLIVNQFNGNYTVSMQDNLNDSDYVLIKDLSNSSLDISSTDVQSIYFSGTYQHSYQVVLMSNGHEYTNLRSNIVTVYYNTALILLNNYDGTFSVDTNNLQSLHAGDKIVIVNNGDSFDISDVYVSFTGVLGQSYYATIQDISGSLYENLISNVLTVVYKPVPDTKPYINNNYNGTYSIASMPTLYGSDSLRLHDISLNVDISFNSITKTFTGVAEHSYYATIVSSGHKYSNYTTDPFVVYYDTSLNLVNNYDGTFSVYPLPTVLYGQDEIVIVDNSGNITYNTTVSGTLNTTYRATILGDGDSDKLYTNLYSNSLRVYYHTPLSLNIDYSSGRLNATSVNILAPGDVIVIKDTGNDSVDLSSTIVPESYHSYYATIKSGSNYYSNLRSDTFTWNYDTSGLTLVNNYDGYFSVINTLTLNGGDYIYIKGPNSSYDFSYNGPFHGVYNKSYYATILTSDGVQYQNMVSNTIHVNYDYRYPINLSINTNDGYLYNDYRTSLVSGDYVKVYDLTTGTFFDGGSPFIPELLHTYYATIGTIDNNYEYSNLYSNEVTQYYHNNDSTFNKTNNYDGTVTIDLYNPMILQPNDKVKITVDGIDTLYDSVPITLTFVPSKTYRIIIFQNNNTDLNYTNSSFSAPTFKRLKINNNYDGSYYVDLGTGVNLYYVRFKINLYKVIDASGNINSSDFISLSSQDFYPDANTLGNTYKATIYDADAHRYYTNMFSDPMTIKYRTRLHMENNYDGTFTVEMYDPILYNDGIIVIEDTDISNNQTYNITSTTFPFTLTGVLNHSYRATIRETDAFGQHLYTNLFSNSLSVSYDTSLSLVNNYDGTFTVENIPTLNVGDQIVVINVDNNDVVIIDNSRQFSGGIRDNTYYATIRDSNLSLHSNLNSNYVTVKYDSTSVLTYANNYNGTYTVTNPRIKKSPDGIYLHSTDGSGNVTLDRITHPCTFSPYPNTTWYLVIISDNTEYTNTRSTTVTENDYTQVLTKIKKSTTDITQEIYRNGYEFDPQNIITSNTYLTINGTENSTIQLEVDILKPSWLINANFDFYLQIVEDSIVDTSSNINTANVSKVLTGPGDPSAISLVRTSNKLLLSTITDDFDTIYSTINQLTSRSHASYYTILVQVIYNSTVIASSFAKLYSRPDNQEFYGGRGINFILHNKCTVDFGSGSGNIYPISDSSYSSYLRSIGTLTPNLTNIWKNLGIPLDGTYSINAGRSEFMSVNISTSTHTVDSTDISYVIVGNNTNSYTTPVFTSTSIDLNYFTGYIDIKYRDVYKQVKSENYNKLRLVVIPRPTVYYALRDLSYNSIPVGRPAYLTQVVRNVQKYDNANDVTVNTSITMISIYTNNTSINLSYLLDKYLTLTWSSRTMSPDNGLFIADPSGNLPDSSLNTISYNVTKSGLLTFLGKDIDLSDNHDVTYYGNVTYTRPKGDPGYLTTVSTSNYSTIDVHFIIDPDLIFQSQINARIFNVDKSIDSNGLSLYTYVKTVDDIDLRSTTYHKNIIVVVENIGVNNIQVQYTGSNSLTIPFAKRSVFMQTSNSSNAWSCYGIINEL